ncbi:alpha/beta fold hydrolase [Paenibacillus sp. LMG 31456]|uniref:Alpha/beta fold hydrolase n=2 Tax=Paenibacillus foliorum TaxID=2654974 RepID=A0A972GT20_9BACL|nr:alpha/beta fold hydrolase [Paenibacillus foliorum]
MRWDQTNYPHDPSHLPTAPIAPSGFINQEDYWERQQPLTFVLIHGSWADSSFWNGIANELRKKGHTVYTPEYPGHGADPNKDVSHSMMTKSIADFIISKNLHNVILLGHSFGGTLVQKVAELVPDRLKRLVFLNAFVLNDGQNLGDELPAPVRNVFVGLAQNSKDNTIMLPFPLYRDAFANLASLELVQQMYNEISPEPAKPLLENLNLKKFYSLNIPKSYIYLTVDNALPQGEGFGWHPHMSSRLGLFRLIKGHGDHMSTVKTEPKMLAQKIYEASRD